MTSGDEGSPNGLCFYDVLADHSVREPKNAKRILDLIVQLWSQSFASHIFALLFHRWVSYIIFFGEKNIIIYPIHYQICSYLRFPFRVQSPNCVLHRLLFRALPTFSGKITRENSLFSMDYDASIIKCAILSLPLSLSLSLH